MFFMSRLFFLVQAANLHVVFALDGFYPPDEATCILAETDTGAIYSISLQSSRIYAEFFDNNQVSGICIDALEGLIFTAGKGTALSRSAGGSNSTGGHIAVVGITGVPTIIGLFHAECTAIQCDEFVDVLVVAVAGLGIFACSYDGTDCWKVVDIAEGYIRNLNVISSTQICYFVDIQTSFIYAVNYMVRSQGAAVPIGSAGAGAVGCTLDYAAGVAYLNVLYSNCRIERCPLEGPFTECSISLPSIDDGACLLMSSTADGVIIYENQQQFLIQIPASGGVVTSTHISISSVSGLSCSCAHCKADFDGCASEPCLYGGTCENLMNGYSCKCLSGLSGKNCETGSPELIGVMEKIEEMDQMIINAELRQIVEMYDEFYTEDAIIEFTGMSTFEGKEGKAEIVDIVEQEYSEVIPYNRVIRQLCDVCFQDRFSMRFTPIDDPQAPKQFYRSVRLMCFDFESLIWKIQSWTVVADAPQNT